MSDKSLSFELKLPDTSDTTGRFTTAQFAVRYDGETIWPVAGADAMFLEIQIDDLLSQLVECWQPLALRQTYPVVSKTGRPSQLRAEAEQRWEEQPAEVAEREDELILNFEDVHDLSKCFAGYFDLAPLWLLRRGDKMIVDTRATMRAVEFDDAWVEITRLGGAIATHLAKDADRWSLLLEAWARREIGDPVGMLAWTTSLKPDVAAKFVDEGILTAPQSLSDAANDNDELRIAARMASALPPDQIRSILELVRSFGYNPSVALKQLSEETSAQVANHFALRRAHEQGEAAARFVRERIGLSPMERCEIGEVLGKLEVDLQFRLEEPAALRALAVSGNRHGPTVFINLKGRQGGHARDARSDWSSRVDMAHELCHLLLDSGHALSAVEILNSRMPVEIEQRAKSFAGALLLPTEAAAEEWQMRQSPRSLDELKTLTFDLQKKFGVTKSVASWKLQHGAQQNGAEISVLLDAIAPER